MKSKFILIIAVIIVIVGAAAFALTRQSSSPSENTNQQESAKSDKGNDVTGTFSDLLKLGQNYTCTYETTDESGSKSSGTIYMKSSGDKLYGEFKLDQEGTEVKSNVIFDGEYSYVWTSDQTVGYKVKVNPEEGSIFGAEESDVETGVNDQENFDFKCAPWLVDDSKFSPPTNIKFTDLTEFTENLNKDLEEVEELKDCSVCNQISEEEARNQCLESLGC